MSVSPGQLNKVFALQHYTNRRWETLTHIHAAFEPVERVIYSKIARSVSGGRITIRRCGIMPMMLLATSDSMYLVSSVEEINRNYLLISAAEAVPVSFTGIHAVQAMGPMNRPQIINDVIQPFSGIIGEKYTAAVQETPNTELETRLVLTTP